MAAGFLTDMTVVSEEAAADFKRRMAELEERLAAALTERDAAIERQTANALVNFRLQSELRAAAERQHASAEILRAISESSGDVERSLTQIAETTARLFGAPSVTIRIAEGDEWIKTIRVGASSQRSGAQPGSQSAARGANLPATVYQENRQIHIPDMDNLDPSMANWPLAATRDAGARTVSGTPLRRKDKAIGALIVYRDRLAPFTTEELAVQQSFADQAVIAIENARLFDETWEALERQTATSDILKVIAGSPSNVQPVFEAIVNSAARLFEPCSATITTLGDNQLHWRGTASSIPGFDVSSAKAVYPIAFELDRSPSARAILERRIVEIPDVTAPDTPEFTRKAAAAGGFQSITFVPLINQDNGIGTVILTHPQLGFRLSEKQLALVQTFADQAVIAIENARLFNETQEALERQTATADILKVIASSPSDVQPVFEAVVRTAQRLLRRELAFILRCDATHFWAVANAGLEGPVPVRNPAPVAIDPATNFPSRAIVSKQNLVVPDWSSTDLPEQERHIREIYGLSSALYLPLLRGGECIGVLGVGDLKPGTFSEAEISLAESFRDQAVIAIENTRLFNETQEALARQTATAEILRVISGSPTDVQPVFDTIVRTAVRLLGCDRVFFMRVDANTYTPVAGVSRDGPAPLGAPNRPVDPATNFPSRAIVEKKTLHLPDWSQIELPEHERGIRDRFGVKAALYLPLLRGDDCIGLLILIGSQPNMFGETEIGLAESFRDQALIAIENARLFNETKEALERQTATADILKVIASSPSDVRPVFAAIGERAKTLLSGFSSTVYRFIEGQVHLEAFTPTTPEADEILTSTFPIPVSRFAPFEIVQAGEVAQIPDTEMLTGEILDIARARGFRSMLFTPLMNEGATIGLIAVTRASPGTFAGHHVQLLKTFADQAVIAIENARLFDEVQAKTRDLQESLQQQTATADVLKVISRSTFDLQTVLETLIESAVELSGANRGSIFLREGDVFPLKAASRATPEFLQYWAANPAKAGRGSATSRVIQSGKVEIIADALEDPEMQMSAGSLVRIRGTLGVPMLRDNKVEGVLVLTRPEPGPFSKSQVDLVQTFADQAVIAVENVRLFDEAQARTRDLSESLQQQTATSEILQIISSSPSDLAPVFDKMLENATRVCGAGFGSMILIEGDLLRQAAFYNAPPELAAVRTNAVRPLHPLSTIATAARDKRVIQTNDIRNSPAYLARAQHAVELAELGGARTIVVVPMLRDDEAIGVITVYRQEVRPFDDKQIELLTSFARQAVIAIENARLLRELRQRTADLSKSLDELRTAQDRLIQTEKLASLGQLTAGIAHEIKNPLNFVNNFAALSAELTDELRDALKPAVLDETIRTEVDELTGLMKDNLGKVVQHGKRADSIVKNMLLHSREGSGEHRPADINALVEESLNLAYHGARAEKPQFNVTLKSDFDPDAGMIEAFPQEITRVLLNLISNGFYAVAKRKAEDGDAGFEPVVSAATKGGLDHVEIRIRDNGTGIPPEVKEKMFNPFFTTKPAGEGTGLGLSMSHDIIVKQHGGTIDVDTLPGAFTEFTIVLPRTSQFTDKTRGQT
jgi:GAF domain-containing protein